VIAVLRVGCVVGCVYVVVQCAQSTFDTILYDIEEFNVDSKAEYSA